MHPRGGLRARCGRIVASGSPIDDGECGRGGVDPRDDARDRDRGSCVGGSGSSLNIKSMLEGLNERGKSFTTTGLGLTGLDCGRNGPLS